MSVGRVSKYAESSFAGQFVWKCGVYLRLSREDGDKLESDSIINQRKIIERYLGKNPDLEIFDTYIDDGFSGTNFNRPALTRLLDDIKSCKVNCLIVKDLSRFGRNYHETGRYLEVVFPLLKLRFISVNDNIDSYKNPQSIKNSTVSFKNVLNDEYARDISSKIRSSFNAKRRKGEYIGSFPLYGYLKDPNDHHKLIIDEEAAENVRLIYRKFLEGLSIYNIAIKLKEMGILNPTEYKISKGIGANHSPHFKSENNGWSTQTIRRMLKNEMYIGNMVQGIYQKVSHKIHKCVAVPKENHIVKEGTHDAIIDRETYEKVQERFKRDTWQSKGEISTQNALETGAIYVGYIKCADCGRAMQRSGYIKRGISFYYFICGSYLQWKQCSRHAIRVNELNKVVLTVLQKYVDMAVEMDKLMNEIQNNTVIDQNSVRIKRDIRACEVEKEKFIRFQNDLYGDFKNEIISREQYFHFKKEYSEKIAELDTTISRLNDELTSSNPDSLKKNNFIETFKKYQNFTELTRKMIEELIYMIYVERDGRIRIEFNFRDAFEEALGILKINSDSGKLYLNEVGISESVQVI